MQIAIGLSIVGVAVPADFGPINGLIWNTTADYLTVDGTDYIIWQ